MKLEKLLFPTLISAALSLGSCTIENKQIPITIDNATNKETLLQTQKFGIQIKKLLKNKGLYNGFEEALNSNPKLITSAGQLLQECVKKSRELYLKEEIISEVQIGHEYATCVFWATGWNKGDYSITLPAQTSIKTLSEQAPFDTTAVYKQVASDDKDKPKFTIDVKTRELTIK